MKRKRLYHHRKRTVQPTMFGWILLLCSWLSLLPVAAYLFRPAHKSAYRPAPFAQAVFATQEETRPELISSIRYLPAVRSLRSDEPTILIYHTHTTEAYTQTEDAQYRETSKWRTSDPENNVIAVGETLKTILERDYGFRVIHDTTDHEPPKLKTAYERSAATMERYHKENPSIVLMIDLHRDAYETDQAPCDFLTIDGRETAKLMFVVGKGEKYADKPYYDANLAFAERMTKHLNGISEKLCRPVRQKPGRYNQHVAPYCMLVEVGHNANTLAQAKNAMPYLAESIAYAFQTEEISLSDWTPN